MYPYIGGAAINRWANEQGYSCGIPTWEETKLNDGTIFRGAVLIPAFYKVQWKNVLDSELQSFTKGSLEDPIYLTYAISQWAEKKSYPLAIPTWEVGTDDGKPTGNPVHGIYYFEKGRGITTIDPNQRSILIQRPHPMTFNSKNGKFDYPTIGRTAMQLAHTAYEAGIPKIKSISSNNLSIDVIAIPYDLGTETQFVEVEDRVVFYNAGDENQGGAQTKPTITSSEKMFQLLKKNCDKSE